MRTVSIRAAKAHLSRLVEDAAAGEEIVITKRGKPVARLVAFGEAKAPRQLGRLNGKIQIPDNFDTMCEEEIRRLFEDGC